MNPTQPCHIHHKKTRTILPLFLVQQRLQQLTPGQKLHHNIHSAILLKILLHIDNIRMTYSPWSKIAVSTPFFHDANTHQQQQHDPNNATNTRNNVQQKPHARTKRHDNVNLLEDVRPRRFPIRSRTPIRRKRHNLTRQILPGFPIRHAFHHRKSTRPHTTRRKPAGLSRDVS
jgi:hypothetical protein